MDITSYSRKEVGALGEKVAREYLRRRGFAFVDQNVSRKTGEIDLIMTNEGVLHFVEVKTVATDEFPSRNQGDVYDPSVNLHEAKVHKVTRTSEWYVAEKGWVGEWQVDAALVWLRRRDGLARVTYLPQIV